MSTAIRQDAFRYGVLMGLREAGCTEKVANEILFSLEKTGYDSKTFVKEAINWLGTAAKAVEEAAPALTGAAGKVPGILSKGKTLGTKGVGWGQGFLDIGNPENIRSVLRAEGYEKGIQHRAWAAMHPKTTLGIGAGAVGLPAYAMGRSSGKGIGQEERDAAYAPHMQQLRNRQQMMEMMRFMREYGGGGQQQRPWWFQGAGPMD